MYLSLRVHFKSRTDTHVRVLANTFRDSEDSKSAQNFTFSTDSTDEHIFYHHEDMLVVRDNIVRCLSRVGFQNEPYDENGENVKDCVRMIRSYLNMRERYTVEFEVCVVKLESSGMFAINLRSDMV